MQHFVVGEPGLLYAARYSGCDRGVFCGEGDDPGGLRERGLTHRRGKDRDADHHSHDRAQSRQNPLTFHCLSISRCHTRSHVFGLPLASSQLAWVPI